MARQAGKTDGLTERGRWWQVLIAEQGASGLSQKAFCRQRGVNRLTFTWWKDRLKHLGSPPAGRPAGRVAARTAKHKASFRQIAGAVRLALPADYEVLLESGRTVRVPAGFDEADLRRLVGVLEAAC